VEAMRWHCPHWSSHHGHLNAMRLLLHLLPSPTPIRLVRARKSKAPRCAIVAEKATAT